MRPDLDRIRRLLKTEEIKMNLKDEKQFFKNKIGKQRRNCWWN